MKRRVLIVDDNEVNRKVLSKILSENYDLLEAENGKTAIEILDKEYESISSLLLDIVMPVMDGYEVIEKIRSDSRYMNMPIIVTTGNTADSAEVKALNLGANDFIVKPYNREVIRCRLKNVISLHESIETINATRIDTLTGLYSRSAFLDKAEALIEKQEVGYYVMAFFDIDNFKFINDQYGNAIGDKLLKYIATTFNNGFEELGGICSRIAADQFIVMYPRAMMESDKIAHIRRRAARFDGSIPPISFSIGRYIVDDLRLTVSAMYDRAAIAMKSVKKSRYDVKIAKYDESMRDKILRKQRIIDEMQTALDKGQFEIWLQPQYNHSTGALIGSEALVRWRHPERGLISPGEFIPIFEDNGFIYEVDKSVWRQACKLIHKWVKNEEELLPISVNISRFDMFREDFFEVVTGLIEEYSIPIELLRLEVTESAFAQSPKLIIDMVQKLVNFGFTVEIDDFGSGYSSLNTLKDVPANILKLDMRFLEGNDNSTRGGNIVESIIRMAKWLGMPVIAEGVETKAQADYLRSVGCSYIQGYLYARPMPVSEYEELTKGSGKEAKIIALETVDTLDNNLFWDPNSMETLIFNSYVGGACIFEYHDGRTELLRANMKYAKEVCGAEGTIEDALAIKIFDYMEERNKKRLSDTILNAIETNEETNCEVCLKGLPNGFKKSYFRTSMRVIAKTETRYLLYCSIINVTAQRKAEIKERKMADQLNAIVSNINGGVTAMVIRDDEPKLLFANKQYYEQIGYTKEQLEEEVQKIFYIVHPSDRDRVVNKTKQASIKCEPFAITYRIIRRDGVVRWIHSNISITTIGGVEEPVQLAVANDITLQREMEQKEKEIAAQLNAIMKNVHGGVSAATLQGDVVNYIFVNDWYYAMFGYTKQQFEEELPRGIVDLIHQDDLDMVLSVAARSQELNRPYQVEFRAYKRNGSMIWVSSNGSICHMEGYEAPVQLAVSNDITAEKKAEQLIMQSTKQLRFLNETAHAMLAQTDANMGIEDVLSKVLDYFGGNRAYVMEVDYDRKVINNTYEVCAEGTTSQKEKLQNIPMEIGQFWFDEFEKYGFISIENVDDLGADRQAERELLEQQNINSLIAVPMYREKRIVGFIGVDDATKHASHVTQLQAIGDYVVVMFVRRSLNAQINNDSKAIEKLMSDTPGGFAHMKLLPSGNIKLLYANKGFCDLVGMTLEELLERYEISALQGIHPEDLDIVDLAVKEMLRTGEVRSRSFRLLHNNGEYIWTSFFGRATKGENGENLFNIYYVDELANN